METRAKKRKRERDLLSIQEEGTIVQSPQTGEISVRGADLESGEDSSDSVTSDAGSAKAAPDDVLHIAHALCKVCAKSPRAVIDFVRRVSPATVGRSIDWDVVREEESSKMGDGRSRWTDMEVRVFLESCLEEMAAFTITSNSPKPQAWQNLIHKMYTKCKKKVNKAQLEYIWGQCKKRYNRWVWLESHASGLGRDPHTSAIVADDEWWESKNAFCEV
ncbi:hypothetical protein OsI_03033 [Oryza sativa Indica Group]|uniref:Myb/SANT-like domain-containing protein n=1 Tax=Oryza sativa subsp. indica TaxID=39946 RepID=A2WT42_ORYSI|nr:hypothetical protein OsI_03033 [Oryza sativa Indica Group]